MLVWIWSPIIICTVFDVYETFLGQLFEWLCNKELFEAMCLRIAKKCLDGHEDWYSAYCTAGRYLSIWILFSYWLCFEGEIMSGTVCSRLIWEAFEFRSYHNSIFVILYVAPHDCQNTILSGCFPKVCERVCNKDTTRFCSWTVIFYETQNTVLTVASSHWLLWTSHLKCINHDSWNFTKYYQCSFWPVTVWQLSDSILALGTTRWSRYLNFSCV